MTLHRFFMAMLYSLYFTWFIERQTLKNKIVCFNEGLKCDALST